MSERFAFEETPGFYRTYQELKPSNAAAAESTYIAGFYRTYQELKQVMRERPEELARALLSYLSGIETS